MLALTGKTRGFRDNIGLRGEPKATTGVGTIARTAPQRARQRLLAELPVARGAHPGLTDGSGQPVTVSRMLPIRPIRSKETTAAFPVGRSAISRSPSTRCGTP